MSRVDQRWSSFGVSVTGPAHLASARPNQDAWSSFHHLWGDGVVVSDGLGSKRLSNFGSRAACVAVERVARKFSRATTRSDFSEWSDEIVRYWLDAVKPINPRDAAATCLFAIRLHNGVIRVGILGDGCVAAVMVNGEVVVLQEDKNGGFSNMTVALDARVDARLWKVRDIPESDCRAVVLCTDGIADDLDNVSGFMREFVEVHCRLARSSAGRRVRKILETWPVPKHSDDKSIACLYRSVSDNE